LATAKRILVTGGAGYVGSVLVDELLRQGAYLRVLDALAHGTVSSLLPHWGRSDFEFVHGDVRDARARADALHGMDAIVHLAAVVGDPACAREPELAREVNIEATRQLVDDASKAGAERFVFASTCSNYGKMSEDALATEEDELRPVSLYAETKVGCELDILSRNGDGPTCTCLRFATVYGSSPRMRFDLTVNEFTRELALDRELVVFGEQFWRPYIHVRDVAAAVALVLGARRETVAGEVFNVGATAENYRKLDLVEILKDRFSRALVTFVHKDEDPRDYRVSFEKVRSRLGFVPARTVADGIAEVAALLRSGLLADPDAPIYTN
jgi:nucleoside-diphosphate-sugar epimerase